MPSFNIWISFLLLLNLNSAFSEPGTQDIDVGEDSFTIICGGTSKSSEFEKKQILKVRAPLIDGEEPSDQEYRSSAVTNEIEAKIEQNWKKIYYGGDHFIRFKLDNHGVVRIEPKIVLPVHSFPDTEWREIDYPAVDFTLGSDVFRKFQFQTSRRYKHLPQIWSARKDGSYDVIYNIECKIAKWPYFKTPDELRVKEKFLSEKSCGNGANLSVPRRISECGHRSRRTDQGHRFWLVASLQDNMSKEFQEYFLDKESNLIWGPDEDDVDLKMLYLKHNWMHSQVIGISKQKYPNYLKAAERLCIEKTSLNRSWRLANSTDFLRSGFSKNPSREKNIFLAQGLFLQKRRYYNADAIYAVDNGDWGHMVYFNGTHGMIEQRFSNAAAPGNVAKCVSDI